MNGSRDQPDPARIRAQLLDLISEMLDQEAPSIPSDTPILDVVGSSLALVEGMRRIYEHFGVLISIRSVIEGQATLDGIATYIEQELESERLRQSGAGPEGEAEARAVPARRVRLAPSQQQSAFLTRYSSEAAAALNEALAIQLDGQLDARALQAALEAVAERYEALQTSLSPDEDELRIQSGRPPALAVSSCAPAEYDQRLAEIVRRPFQLGDRLFRAELLRPTEDRHVLVLVSHALVMDPEAVQLVLGELGQHYSAYSQDREPAAGFPAIQWTDYLAMGEADRARSAREAAHYFWRDTLPQAGPQLELPTDWPRPPVKNYAGARLALPLEAGLLAGLQRLAESPQGLSIADIVFGAYTLYLSRLAGQSEVVVGVRSGPLFLDLGQQVVAQTHSMLPVLVEVDPQRSFVEHIRTQAASLAEAQQNRHFSLAEMIQLAKPARDQSRSPLFTAAFSQQHTPAPPAFGALQTAWAHTPAPGARYDLELALVTAPDGAWLVCDYSTELFAPETIGRWLDGLVAMLRAGLEAAEPETACGVLPMMSAVERQKLLLDWNRTQQPYPKDQTVLDLVAARAGDHPNAPAVRCDETVLTFQQLLQRVQVLAALLVGHGVAAGDRVGILLNRSPDLIAALLAAWRVGATYVPLDPGFPRKRLAYMLEDAGVRAIVTSRSLASSLPEEFTDQAVWVDGPGPAPAEPVQLRPARATDSAYIIYTSGSTGLPKGVQVGHQGLVNCLLAVHQMIGLQAGDALLAITTVSFDIATVELLMPLIAGGVVDIAPDGVVADGLRLAELIAAHQPAYLQATPSIWKMVLAAGWQGQARLGMLSGGETLSRELAEQLLGRGRSLWNLYGPTETTVWSLAAKVASAPDQLVDVGRPLANTQVYVLDDQLQPAAPGAVGELYIGGDGLAQGYWRRPELTASRFVRHPFRADERLYRTGDLARYRPDGSLLCLGRLDDQAKIHGVRVEPGEVEAALRKVAGVADAVVTCWRDGRGDMQLVGHVVAAAPGVSASEIRAQLREYLPEAIIPPYIVFSEAFPLTANGKIQRAALPTPDSGAQSASAPLEMPATSTERLLAEAWARVLGIETRLIGRDADFIDLGGHSLLMTPMTLEVRRLFEVNFKLYEFFGAATVRSLAALIDKRRWVRSDSALGGLGGRPAGPQRGAEWGRQRMAFLLREAQLPASLAPVRGMTYQPTGEIETVLLTGGTGFLGAYLIAEILRTTRAEVYCLVRPKRGHPGKDRIEALMRRHAVWREDNAWQDDWQSRVHVVSGDVTLPRLGMTDTDHAKLVRETDAILHGAAHVNFIYPYEALRATNVLGLHEIIRFAFDTRIKPVHHVSTAAIWPMGAQHTFYERDPIEHGQALAIGYDEAKWVGERCLLYAEERGLPVARYRPGEVGGDSATGQGVTDHFAVAIIKGFLQFGAFPALDIAIDVAPIDYVAKALTYLMFHRNPLGRAFHLTNPSCLHASEAMTFLRGQGYQFDEMPFTDLRDKMLASRDFGANALFAFQTVLEEMDEVSLQLPTYDTAETRRELRGSGISCAPADEKLFGLYLSYLQNIGYMPLPQRMPVGRP